MYFWCRFLVLWGLILFGLLFEKLGDFFSNVLATLFANALFVLFLIFICFSSSKINFIKANKISLLPRNRYYRFCCNFCDNEFSKIDHFKKHLDESHFPGNVSVPQNVTKQAGRKKEAVDTAAELPSNENQPDFQAESDIPQSTAALPTLDKYCRNCEFRCQCLLNHFLLSLRSSKGVTALGIKGLYVRMSIA